MDKPPASKWGVVASTSKHFHHNNPCPVFWEKQNPMHCLYLLSQLSYHAPSIHIIHTCILLLLILSSTTLITTHFSFHHNYKQIQFWNVTVSLKNIFVSWEYFKIAIRKKKFLSAVNKCAGFFRDTLWNSK